MESNEEENLEKSPMKTEETKPTNKEKPKTPYLSAMASGARRGAIIGIALGVMGGPVGMVVGGLIGGLIAGPALAVAVKKSGIGDKIDALKEAMVAPIKNAAEAVKTKVAENVVKPIKEKVIDPIKDKASEIGNKIKEKLTPKEDGKAAGILGKIAAPFKKIAGALTAVKNFVVNGPVTKLLKGAKDALTQNTDKDRTGLDRLKNCGRTLVKSFAVLAGVAAVVAMTPLAPLLLPVVGAFGALAAVGLTVSRVGKEVVDALGIGEKISKSVEKVGEKLEEKITKTIGEPSTSKDKEKIEEKDAPSKGNNATKVQSTGTITKDLQDKAAKIGNTINQPQSVKEGADQPRSRSQSAPSR